MRRPGRTLPEKAGIEFTNGSRVLSLPGDEKNVRCFSGVALLGTWASIQWAPNWADELSKQQPGAKQWTMFCSAMGAVLASLIAPLVGAWLGRRITYCLLCVTALAATFDRTESGSTARAGPTATEP